MIKRDGVSLMNNRTKGVSIARETMEVIEKRQYTSPSGNVVDIASELNSSITNTVLYNNGIVDLDHKTSPDYSETTTLGVTDETTAQAAVRLLSIGKSNIVALNFASARNQGGGFLSGAIAQEEDLCRCSGLYACLKTKPMFYNENILCDNSFYTDNIIYSPNVPFFRNEFNLFLEEPYLLSIISAPAPNVRAMENVDEVLLEKILFNRSKKILQIAKANGHKTIILGAWGCGVFGNSADMVGKLFMKALKEVPVFEHVCFAIYDNKPDQPTFKTFQDIVK